MVDRTVLHLPREMIIALEGDARDRSVFGPIESTGVWEPHITALFEAEILPGWTCLDLGANIGCHTLAMATLAYEGRVFAFEASSRNFAHLVRNVSALSSPCASVSCVPLALSDRAGTVELASIIELAGCSFVAPNSDADLSERLIHDLLRLREEPSSKLEVTSEHVDTVRLDEWTVKQGLTRLDIIKIDIEGSERCALEGARETLQRFDPLLITEYNPACASAYRNEPPHSYYELLASLFEDIRVIGASGLLSETLRDWQSLRENLPTIGPGFLDLCCRRVRR